MISCLADDLSQFCGRAVCLDISICTGLFSSGYGTIFLVCSHLYVVIYIVINYQVVAA